ncbi:(3,5-dihydroxyphenyl)acetyl-CoA 1,2-dioxygenase DpgC [Streptomyces ardesiacus]|uniref:(3,5-dihydroxyphenyl)acetyl-CoA 1,2-dioxygenase DpgC n=1 Tax=Streptomyces ardesiacus TaxID=285564 RepID=UPI00201EEA15|nr:(3,5-dihydroxyphenyl)acetyl-CoA 1,2-dioxygenase DpgC [Streptomyces ardesiacus]MCL7364076.1 enoyl-CoA hydratase/isomerase family protein [Streptomyces ardesiacus]
MSGTGEAGRTTARPVAVAAHWSARTPVLSGSLLADAGALRTYTAEAEKLLGELPAKPGRDPGQQQLATEVFDDQRRLRSAFLELHAERVYEELTGGLREHRTLSELVTAASEAFPGLTPTETQMAAERACATQADKDGREIDQGLFFHWVLRSPQAGPHLMQALLRPTRRARSLLGEFDRTGSLDLGTVRLERVDRAAHLTLCNGRFLNAEDNQLVDDLETAVDLALLDDRVAVGVLRGGKMTHPRYQGRRVFCAGINLVDLHQGRISFVDFLLRRELGHLHKLIRGVRVDDAWPRALVEKPWVAAVDSFAIGGGMQVLFAVDHVVAAADSYFSLPAAQEGIVPGMANLRLTALAGGRLSRQVILSGRKLWAREPEAGAVCDEVVDPKMMDASIEAAVARLASPAVVPNRHMINVAEEPVDHLRAYAAEFALEQALRLYSADVIDKVDRFRAGTSRERRTGSGS